MFVAHPSRISSSSDVTETYLTPAQCSKIIRISKPNREIPHPKSKELFPIIYSLLSDPSEELSTYFLMNNLPNIFYQKSYNHKTLSISLLHSAILQKKANLVNCIFYMNLFPLGQINTPYHPVGSSGVPGPSETALSLATRQYQPTVMQQLIERGAKIHQKNPDQEDCLTKAVKHGSSAKTLQFLFEQKEVKNHPVSPLLLHALIGNSNPKMLTAERIACINILLAHNNHLNTLNQNDHTPLFESIKNPQLKDISLHLLFLGADPSELFKTGSNLTFSLPNAAPILEVHASRLHSCLLKITKLIPELISLIIEHSVGVPRRLSLIP